jgi:transcriptional regulator with XRE-family HTH domain
LKSGKQGSDLAVQLRQAITDSGLSLNEMERRSKVNHAVLSRFMRGQRTLTLPIASRLCGALGLRLAALGGAGKAGAAPASPPVPNEKAQTRGKKPRRKPSK